MLWRPVYSLALVKSNPQEPCLESQFSCQVKIPIAQTNRASEMLTQDMSGVAGIGRMVKHGNIG